MSDKSSELAVVKEDYHAQLVNSLGLYLLTGQAQFRNGTLAGQDVFHFGKMMFIVRQVLKKRAGSRIRENADAAIDWWRSLLTGYTIADTRPVIGDEDLLDAIDTMISSYNKLLDSKVITPPDIADAAIYVDKLLQARFNKEVDVPDTYDAVVQKTIVEV